MTPRVAEFFAGIGLVRVAYEAAGARVVFANDIEPFKASVYREQYGDEHLVVGDVADVSGVSIPEAEIAVASFPCTDLSSAGGQDGMHGSRSGMFWEFARILNEMGSRRPGVVQIENVIGLATSNQGEDLYRVITILNGLGYSCDLLTIDAQRFVPQSRPRLFIVGLQGGDVHHPRWQPHALRPDWVRSLGLRCPELHLHAASLPEPPNHPGALDAVMEPIADDAPAWWPQVKVDAFLDTLMPIHRAHITDMFASREERFATAYRRTRDGLAVWEIRNDGIAGCLRCPRGGSSKQAVVRTYKGEGAVRWMTALEYARLQGAPSWFTFDSVTPTQAMFGFGDAVCVPVVQWLAEQYVLLVAAR